MDVTFNTGRLYTPNGQIVRAVVGEGFVYFRDFSRMIAGQFAVDTAFVDGLGYSGNPERDFVHAVMRNYDGGMYTNVSLWNDGVPQEPAAIPKTYRI